MLLAAGPNFDPNQPGVIVVYFHGNQTILARDVVDRQQTVRQLAQSNLNAVMVAPQLAVDANEFERRQFLAPRRLRAVPRRGGRASSPSSIPGRSRGAFQRMPVIVVAYSGGYMPAAYSLVEGGAGDRVRGVVLLDALYGEGDKFARWIEAARGGAFFVSAYSASTRDQNAALRARLQRDGVRGRERAARRSEAGRRRLRRFRRRQSRQLRQRRLDQRSAQRRAVAGRALKVR